MENVALLKEYVKTGVQGYAFRPWKLGLLAVATILMVVGGGLRLAEGDRAVETPRVEQSKSDRPDPTDEIGRMKSTTPGDPLSIAPGGDPALPPGVTLDDPSIVPGPTTGSPGDERPGEESPSVDGALDDVTAKDADWSPAFLKGGFGFFVGFCVGFAIRTLLRLAALVVGFNLLIIVVMSSMGWVEVHWSIMGDQFDLWVDSLGPDFKSFQAFLLGRLPATGLTALGLFTGLRRK